MDERMKNNENFAEVSFKRLMDALLSKLWAIMLSSVLGAVIVATITYFFVTPLYQSSAMFYVNNNSISVGDATLSIDSGDISASKSLVNTYIVILNTKETLNDVIDYAGLDRRYTDLEEMIEAESVDDTEVFRVVVTSEDPNEADKIADAIAYILPKRISSIVEGTSAKIVDSAIVASRPSSPSYTINTLLGLMLGFVFSAGLIIINQLFDTTIRNEDDITQLGKLPILSAVPDMTTSSKGGYYYGYGEKKPDKKKKLAAGKLNASQSALFGDEISFSASEAYKLLRTKLQFSFADDNTCRVIGLSSALSGEGKSLTAINLAYTLSQLDKKVLLIDCDMRRPTLAEKLSIQKAPGLSNYLTGQVDPDHIIQYCGIPNAESAFHVISAGECPPNPLELLSSIKMTRALNALRKLYDYVILDLPPVGEVSDALSVAKVTDGMLLVVRQDYCDRILLADTLQQFAFVEAKLLGVVLNCANDYGGKGYYRKGYYKKGYYRRYYRRNYYRRSYYRRSYENKQSNANEK